MLQRHIYARPGALLALLLAVSGELWSNVSAGRIRTGASTGPSYGYGSFSPPYMDAPTGSYSPPYTGPSPPPAMDACAAVLPIQCADLPTFLYEGTARIVQLEQKITDLTKRLEALEQRFGSTFSPPSPPEGHHYSPPDNHYNYPPWRPWTPWTPSWPVSPIPPPAPPSPPTPVWVAYPPDALTGPETTFENLWFGNGVYRVSASSDLSYPGSTSAYMAFDKQYYGSGGSWTTADSSLYDIYYPFSYNGAAKTYEATEVYAGEWVQLQMPEAIRVTTYAVYVPYDMPHRGPKDFALLGSNDGYRWQLVDKQYGIMTWSMFGFWFTAAQPGEYSYYRLVVQSNNGAGYLSINELVLVAILNGQPVGSPPSPPPVPDYTPPPTYSTYGGPSSPPDSPPVPTYSPSFPPNTSDAPARPPYVIDYPSYPQYPSAQPSPLPYPPAPLTGYDTDLENVTYGNGIYRVRASSDLGYPEAAWEAFDYQLNTGQGHMWTVADYNLYDSSYPYSYLGAAGTQIGEQWFKGEWIQIEMPTKVKVVQYKLWTRDGDLIRGPKDFVLVGSNDGSSWAVVDERSSISYWNPSGFSFDVAGASSYSFYRLCVASNNGGGWLTLYEMVLYGLSEQGFQPPFVNPPSSIPSSPDLPSSPSFTDYTERPSHPQYPSSPPSPMRYPPAPLAGYNSNLLNQAYGNGMYRVRASSDLGYPEAAWEAFDYQLNTRQGHMWTVADYNLYDSSYPYRYLGRTSTLIGSQWYLGEWIQIEMPEQIRLVQYKLWTRDGDMLDRGPKDFVLIGSNDGSSWAVVDERAAVTNWTTAGYSFDVTGASNYSFYRLCVATNNGGGWLTLYEMVLYGFPGEQGSLDVSGPPPHSW
ncbi:hypothetical protein Agub_g2247 [Astrephomene gubernaculifera]|uniref:F5/8 type C domain-containing protein n=1 Tax=Astrephomene gubernaculifera TaxID=47775 RepID=A0AAD3DGR8_9CHLO|nr:hypothetical protein Agub_g2247 [Astrephomene gubernaculifera]